MIDFNNLAVYAGAGLLGAVAGLVGSFSVLGRRALANDALAHATLPGLCLAFLIVGNRNLPALLVGALCTGWLGVAAISALRRWTRIREDSAICIVLSVFFGAGIAPSRSIENSSAIGGKAGLDSFLLGNMAGMTRGELGLLAALIVACLLLVALLYKEFKLAVFDASFARSQGWPVPRLDFLLMAAAGVAVTLGISTVGVVLMAALLILPAAAARLWTDHFDRLLIVSSLFGAVTCVIGTVLSSRYEPLPDGPFVILSGAALFLISFLFSPRRGVIARILQQRRFQHDLAAGQVGLIERKSSLPDELANLPEITEGYDAPFGRPSAKSSPCA